MAKVIISNDFPTLVNADITARSEVATYPKLNVTDHLHLKRRFRADDLVKSDVNPLIYFDLGSKQVIIGVFLNDINFDRTRILGNANDLGVDWTFATFASGVGRPVSEDRWVKRRKIYIPLTGFDLQWLAVMTPAAANAVGSYQTKWEVGSIVLIKSKLEFSKNAFMRTAEKPFEDIDLSHGGSERMNLGDNLIWRGDITLDQKAETDESEWIEVNALDISKPVVLYENRTDDCKAYLALRNEAYQGTLPHYGLVSGNTISFKELV